MGESGLPNREWREEGGRGVVVDGLCSREGEMYSSRRSSATSGIENEKLAGNVCMNAAGQLARGERKRREAARRISWYPRSERAHTHAPTSCRSSLTAALCDLNVIV